MIHADIYVTLDAGAAEAIRDGRLLTVEQAGSWTLIASGKAHKTKVILQANSYIEVGPYQAVRVFQGKTTGKLIYQAHAEPITYPNGQLPSEQPLDTDPQKVVQ